MKNQRMILLLAGLTTGIIVLLFVVDFVLPKRRSVGSVGLLGKGKASLFGAKTSPFRLSGKNGKKDELEALTNKLDLVTQKLDKVIEIVESLTFSREIKPMSQRREAEPSRYEKVLPASAGNEHPRLGGSGKLITPFTELYNPNKKREQEAPSPDAGLLGRDKLPMSGGSGSTPSFGSEEGPGVRKVIRDARADEMPDGMLPSNTIGNASLKAGDRDGHFPKKPIFGSSSERGLEKGSGTASESKDKSDGLEDSLDKFIGEIFGKSFGEITETTPNPLSGESKAETRSKKDASGEKNEDGMLSFRTFDFTIPVEEKISSASEEKSMSGADGKGARHPIFPPFEKGKLSEVRSDIKKEKDKPIPGNLGLNRSDKHDGKPVPLSTPLEPHNARKDAPFPENDIHKIVMKKDSIVGGPNEHAGRSSKRTRNNLRKHVGDMVLSKGSLYLDDNETSVGETGNESTEDYSSSGSFRLLGLGEEGQKHRIPLVKT